MDTNTFLIHTLVSNISVSYSIERHNLKERVSNIKVMYSKFLRNCCLLESQLGKVLGIEGIAHMETRGSYTDMIRTRVVVYHT